VHTTQVGEWKKALLAQAPGIFDAKRGPKPDDPSASPERLFSEIGRLKMDGRGRPLDNIFVERLWRSVKHEDVCLKGYVSMTELQLGLTEYFVFYNTERPHQSLGNSTPRQVYQTASGGGARIVDKFVERKTTLKTEAATARC
jgi:putative transposase